MTVMNGEKSGTPQLMLTENWEFTILKVFNGAIFMKHKIFCTYLIFGLGACSSQSHKAQPLVTELAQPQAVGGSQTLGLKEGDMVVMDKVQASEKLRELQNSVFEIEDRVYGTRKLGTLGLYGELKSCERKLASRQYGGNGTLLWAETLDRVTDKEEELKLGVDEKNNLVAINEEFLKNRLQRYQNYRTILQKRADQYEDQIEKCKLEVAARELDSSQSSKVMVQEVPKSTIDKAVLNNFMCSYVKPGASLQQLLSTAFIRGWLVLADFQFEQNLLPVALKDSKGIEKSNALLFNGWRLAFDKSPISVGELMAGQDTLLVAWSYDKKSEIPDSASCLSAEDGQWNPLR